MKHTLSILPFLFLALHCFSQIHVGEVNINDPANEIYYIEVTMLLGHWYIDYGSGEKPKAIRNKTIKAADGSTAENSSKMAVFNFLRRNGWEYLEVASVDQYAGTTWIFRRIE